MTHAPPDTNNPRTNLPSRLESKGVVVGTKKRSTISLVFVVVISIGRLFAVRLRRCLIGHYSFPNEQFDSKFMIGYYPTEGDLKQGLDEEVRDARRNRTAVRWYSGSSGRTKVKVG